MEKTETIILKKGTTKTEYFNFMPPFTKGISIEISVLISGLRLYIANAGTNETIGTTINLHIKTQMNANGRGVYWFEYGELKENINLKFLVSDIPYKD